MNQPLLFLTAQIFKELLFCQDFVGNEFSIQKKTIRLEMESARSGLLYYSFLQDQLNRTSLTPAEKKIKPIPTSTSDGMAAASIPNPLAAISSMP